MTIKTATARKPVKLSLTSRAKSPRVAKTSKRASQPANTDLKELLAASIEAVAVTTGLDGDAAVPAAQIGEPVRAAKAKAKKAEKAARPDRLAPVIKTLKVDLDGIKGVDPVPARTYAEMLASCVGVTPRDLATATGLDTRQRCKVDRRLFEAGYRLKHRRDPARADKSDPLTAYLYWIEA